MKHCPTCGAVMRDDRTVCEECGLHEDADPDHVDSGDRPDRSIAREHPAPHSQAVPGRDDPSGRDETSQREDGDSQSGQPDGSPAGTPDRQPVEANTSGAGGRSVPLDRRTLLFGSAGAIALAGGWAFFLRDDNEAKTVVEEFYRALDQADTERAQSLIHDDGPLGDRFSGPSQSFLEERTFTLELIEEYDRESADDQENVREFVYFGVVITIRRTTSAGEEETERTAQQVTVAQTPEGEYRIWQF